jgi:GT2 family glycosyltransferase
LIRRLKPISFELKGWGNPLPLVIRPTDGSDVARLRAGIKSNLVNLVPRCEGLDRSIPEWLLGHKGYAASKIRRKFVLELATIDPVVTPPGRPIDPAPAIRHQAMTASPGIVPQLLSRSRRILCVGEVTVPTLREALGVVSSAVTTVTPGDGEFTVTASGRKRPAANSFSAWQARQDEADRAEISIFVLGRQAGRADVELLRHRVHARQRVFVEAGSAALTWLLAAWDGANARDGDVFVLSEPDPWFQEPSRRFRPAQDTDWPRITVVTVSYNQRDYLEQCLRSVLDQRYDNLEYIVVDACSTDGSIELLKRYEHCFAKLIVEPDEGQSDGLNKGFRRATGDILTWVNSDDMLAPLSLKRVAMAMRATGVDLVAGTCKRIGGGAGQVTYQHHSALPTLCPEPFSLHGPLDWCSAWEKGDYFFQPEVFFTRSIWERAGGYLKPHLFWAMDWELWLRCALAGATIVRIPDILGLSREHSAQKTTAEELYLWQIVGILREYDDLLGLLEAKVRGVHEAH